MTEKLATLGYQLTYLYKNTDALAAAVKDKHVQLLHNAIARRSDGHGGYEHQAIAVGTWVPVTNIYNEGFNGVKVYSHLEGNQGWVLEVDITDCASVVDTVTFKKLATDVQFKRDQRPTQRRIFVTDTIVKVEGEVDGDVLIRNGAWTAVVRYSYLKEI